MNSKAISMVNDHQEQQSRNIVDKIRVRVPPMLFSSSPSDEKFNCFSQCCFSQFLIQNRSNFKRSGLPDRFMYYTNGSWVDFGGKVWGDLRLGFSEGKAAIEVGIDGVQYLFDFYRMLQIDLETGVQRSIAWIDVDGQCFFPKTFVDGGDEEFASRNPTIEIEIRIGEDFISTKRKREAVEFVDGEGKTEGSSSNYHSDGLKKPRIVANDVEQPRWPKANLLNEGDQAHSIVKNLFLSRLANVEPGATITAIHKFTRTGPIDRARYEVFQKQMEITKAARGGVSNMTFAWHGTSAKGVASILSHGFGLPSEVPGPQAHGVGIYLSPVRSPHISAMLSEVDDRGEKHVILCRVILGKCEKIEAGSKQLYPSSVDFDTGVDDLNNPKWYVVWTANMNSHILPECIISYKSSDSSSGQLRGSPLIKSLPNALIGKLFSKLWNLLPSSKLKELKTLCSTFKDGKMGKDTFMEHVRSIAGDEMLLSTIREVRG